MQMSDEQRRTLNSEIINRAYEAAFACLRYEWTLEYIAKTNYAAYLQTDHWQQQRKLATARANFSCQLCDSTERLEVHHRTYKRVGRERQEDLTVLCHTCHERFHRAVERQEGLSEGSP